MGADYRENPFTLVYDGARKRKSKYSSSIL